MTFAALKDMARVVQEYKSEHTKIPVNTADPNFDAINRLYHILLGPQYQNETDAIQAFFQDSQTDYPYYELIKDGLKQHLIRASFHIDLSRIKVPRQQAYFKSQFSSIIGEMMYHLGGTTASLELLEEALVPAQKHEFAMLGTHILFYLKCLYTAAKSDSQKYSQYAVLQREFEKIRKEEILSWNYYEDLIQYYINNTIPNLEISTKAHTYFEELHLNLSHLSTPQYKQNMYNIGIIKFTAMNDYSQALDLSEVALTDLIDKQNINSGAIMGFLAQKMFCLIHLKVQDPEQASNTMKQYWKLTPKNTYNAFRGHELEIFYTLHTRQYPQALQHYEKGRNHPLYPNIKGMLYESWQLYGGYLHLLAELGQLDKKAVEKTAGPFRYSKFINDIKIMSKEKEGMNIPLVNLPILFSLAKGDGNFPEEYMATLERYRKRYLRSDMNIRSASFVKLLLLLARKPFEGKNVDRKIEKELAVLRQQQPQFSRQTIAIEIIPYEDLWWLLTGTPV